MSDELGSRWNPRISFLCQGVGFMSLMGGLSAAGVRPWPAGLIALGVGFMAQAAVAPLRKYVRDHPASPTPNPEASS